MRTLEEIQSELDFINGNLEIIASIANQARPYTPYDLSTWNAIGPTTAGRIRTLQQDIIGATNSVADYVKGVAVDLYIGRRSKTDAQTESSRATKITQALVGFADAVNAQADRLNNCQAQIIERAKKQGGEIR